MIHAFVKAEVWGTGEVGYRCERTPWLGEYRMRFHGMPIRITTDWHDDDEELLWL